jgi:Domain of unknown function (DUF4340)
MRHRSSIVLFIFFLSGLGVLWWADRAKVKSRRELEDLVDRVVPELVDVTLPEVCRIELIPGPGAEPGRAPLVLERRPDASWQLLKPVDAAADANLVDTLIHNLKDLRQSAEAGTITGGPAPYGLDKPTATLTLFGRGDKGQEGPYLPITSIEIGKKEGRRLYVRPQGGSGIEVVDSVMLEPLTVSAARWRDTAMLHVPSFQVESVDIREAAPVREIALKRDERRWRLVAPIWVPADDDRVEGLVAELSALRVADGTDGFVASDVSDADLGKYGLDKPALVVTVTSFARGDKRPVPQSIRLGAEVPGKAGQVYAVRGDQNDVVRVDAKRLREAIPGVDGLRSQKVLDIVPSRVNRLKIDARGQSFDLARTSKGWQLLAPVQERADSKAVMDLLTKLAELKASEFLDEKTLADPRLNPPNFRVRGWQVEAGKASASEPEKAQTPREPEDAPRFDLAFGRRDTLKKSVFGRVAGDTTVLAMPDAILADLPANAFAYRSRAVVSFSPQNVTRLVVDRGTSSITLEAPEKSGPVNQWRIVAPVPARADTAAVTSLLVAVSSLRAENWEADQPGDARAFGLNEPRIRIRWTLKRSQSGSASPKESAAHAEADGELKIGRVRPGSNAVYAQLGGDPRVFMLKSAALAPFEQELHDKTVLSFRPESLERVVFRWPDRTVTLNPYTRPGSKTAEWQVVLGHDSGPLDLNLASLFINTLGALKTTHFLQYDGPLPVALGLDQPRLTVQLKLVSESSMRTLRIGNSLAPNSYAATTAAGNSGPVFLFEALDAWKALLAPPTHSDDLPADPFAPLPTEVAK